MNKPGNIITTPSGDQMVVLPLAEYERLVEAVEDAADIRAYDGAKRRLAEGRDESIPAEFVDRILNGENKIRVWREYRGLTLKALAETSGLAAAYLSQIETGKREGTIETFKKSRPRCASISTTSPKSKRTALLKGRRPLEETGRHQLREIFAASMQR
jgi:DNA-binding XRE family transcriptional regulator